MQTQERYAATLRRHCETVVGQMHTTAVELGRSWGLVEAYIRDPGYKRALAEAHDCAPPQIDLETLRAHVRSHITADFRAWALESR